MTRINAREIAVQQIFSLSFGDDCAAELLKRQLTPERFAELAEEMPLYAQFPNEKQEQYIRELVLGVFAHGPELDALARALPNARLRSLWEYLDDLLPEAAPANDAPVVSIQDPCGARHQEGLP